MALISNITFAEVKKLLRVLPTTENAVLLPNFSRWHRRSTYVEEKVSAIVLDSIASGHWNQNSEIYVYQVLMSFQLLKVSCWSLKTCSHSTITNIFRGWSLDLIWHNLGLKFWGGVQKGCMKEKVCKSMRGHLNAPRVTLHTELSYTWASLSQSR